MPRGLGWASGTPVPNPNILPLEEVQEGTRAGGAAGEERTWQRRAKKGTPIQCKLRGHLGPQLGSSAQVRGAGEKQAEPRLQGGPDHAKGLSAATLWIRAQSSESCHQALTVSKVFSHRRVRRVDPEWAKGKTPRWTRCWKYMHRRTAVLNCAREEGRNPFR